MKAIYISLLLLGLVPLPKASAQYFVGLGVATYNFSGALSGYKKSNTALFVKNTLRLRCNGFIGSTQGNSPDTLILPNSPLKNCIFYLNNHDTSVIRSMNYIPQTNPSSHYSLSLTESSCNHCSHSLQYQTAFLKYFNEYATDSFILSTPQNPSFVVDSGIDALTVYHGTFDIFQDLLCMNFENVTPGGIPYIFNRFNATPPAPPLPIHPPTHFYSRIYRFHDYANISSPDAQNRHMIIGVKGQNISYNPGYTDKEGDSINVVPLLLHVADTSPGHPLAYTNQNVFCNGSVLNAQQRDSIKSLIRNHTVPIQYQPGYSHTNPFGPGSNFVLNPKTGEFSFTAQDTGLYLLAFRVEEYRNSQLLGDFMSYRIAFVTDTSATLPVISNPFNITGGVYNAATQRIDVCAGLALSYSVKATSTLASAQLAATSNAQQTAPAASVNFTGQNTDSVGFNFSWTPGKDDIGYHYIYLDAVDTACGNGHFPAHQSKGITVYVHGVKIMASDTTVCEGDTATLQSYTSGVNTWSVIQGDPYLPCVICDAIKVSPSVPTTYVLSNKYQQCNAYDTITLWPVPSFSIQASNDTGFTGPIPGNYSLSVSVSPPGHYHYQWYPASKVSNATQPTTVPVGWTNHNMYVIEVKDTFGCFTRMDTVNVDANTAGVRDIAGAEQAFVYPNPTTGIFMMETSTSGLVTIMGSDGREIIRFGIGKGVSELKLPANSTPGIYTVIFEAEGSGAKTTRKLVYKP